MYNFVFPSYYANCANYDNLFGVCFGENFADTIDECFYNNSIHNYGHNYSGHSEGMAPMDGELTLNYLMGAIYAVYKCASGPRRNSAIAKLLGFKHRDSLRGIIVSESFDENITPIVKLENVSDNVGNAIVWAAYFFSCIKASFHNEESEVSEYLRNLFLRQTHMDEYTYCTSHVCSLLFDLYFETSVKKIAEALGKHESCLTTGDEDLGELEEESEEKENDNDKERESLSDVMKTRQQTIDNLTRQNEEMKARIVELEEALNPTQIDEKYLKELRFVFTPSYKVEGQSVSTYRAIQETCSKSINPLEATMMALFVHACINVGCVRDCALSSATSIVKAFMGLRLLPNMDDSEIKKYSNNLGKKFSRIAESGLTEQEGEVCKRAQERLRALSDDDD